MTAFLTFIGLVVASNVALVLFGVIPIGFGLMAPAGTLLAGLTFSARDWLQERRGRRWVLAAIGIGAVISAVMSPALALASGAAFLVSEASDMAVYTPLRRRWLIAAVVLSNSVGLVIDSALFLWLAFGSLDYLAGLAVGKVYMTAIVVAAIWIWRWRR